MKTAVATATEKKLLITIPSKDKVNESELRKEILKLIGYSEQTLKENKVQSYEAFEVRARRGYVSVSDGKYGRSKTEFFRFKYDTQYYNTDTSTSYGEKVTYESKVNDLREYIGNVIKNKNAHESWAKKIKAELPKDGIIAFSTASVHEWDGGKRTTITLNVPYGKVTKFDISIDNPYITIEEENGKTKIEYSYSTDFSKSYDRKETIGKIEKFKQGVELVESAFKSLLEKIK